MKTAFQKLYENERDRHGDTACLLGRAKAIIEFFQEDEPPHPDTVASFMSDYEAHFKPAPAE